MNAKFMLSVADVRQLPAPQLPEIAFAGRSNVGKSSLINKILNKKDLVKTGKTPGKTRLLNFFNIDDKAVFVDLPGYGFAKVSKAEMAGWGRMIDGYFKYRSNLAMCLILIDIRRSIQDEERQLIALLEIYGITPCIVLTKADKLSKNELLNARHRHAKEIGMNVESVIHVSTVTGDGVKSVQAKISEIVESIKWD